MIILSATAFNNQPVPHPTRRTYNINFSLNEVVLELLSGKVCAKVFLSIVAMVIRDLDFGGDSASRDHKKIVNESPQLICMKTFWIQKVR